MRVEAAQPPPLDFIGDRLAQFLVDEDHCRTPSVRVQWRNADPSDTKLGEPIYFPGSIWRLYRSPDGHGFTAVISYQEDGALTPRAAVLEANGDWTEFRLTENVQKERFPSLLNLGAGELIIRTRLIMEGGVVFHSCAVDDNGKGVLMVGHSGAGKSTQSLIWAGIGAKVLSDDRIAVRVVDNQAVAYGTPWGGSADIVDTGEVSLRAILVLGQSPENELQRLEPLDAVPRLLVRSFLPYWDRDLVARAAETVDKLVQAVPVFSFRCRPDESVVPVVRSVL